MENFPIGRKKFPNQNVRIHVILEKDGKILDSEICRSISLKPRTLMAPNTLFKKKNQKVLNRKIFRQNQIRDFFNLFS